MLLRSLLRGPIMKCDVCQKRQTGLAWVSSPSGTYVVCTDCARPLQAEVHDLIARLARCDSQDTLIGELLTAAMDATGADMGNVQLADENRVLRIRAQAGFEREFLDFFSGVQENEAACGTAAADHRTVVVPDVEQSPIFIGTPALTILRNAGVRAVQSTPMFSSAGTLVGVVSTHFRHPHAFISRELDRVSLLAAQAAALIGGLSAVRS
jgi:GAF domain-containing protein